MNGAQTRATGESGFMRVGLCIVFVSALIFLFSCSVKEPHKKMDEPREVYHNGPSRVHDAMLNNGGFVQWEDTVMEMKATSVDIFAPKQLEWKGSFNIDMAMKGLYPGNYYKVFGDLGEVRVSLWKSTSHKTVPLFYYWDMPDSNGTPFPDTSKGIGVDTRLLDTAMFKSSDGKMHVLLSTSSTQAEIFDMILTGRFAGGVLGLAMFDQTEDGWKLRCFDPAVGIYGSFSACPPPQKLMLGKDNFGCIVNNSNGGAGGPYTNEMTVVAIVEGKFKKVFSSDFNFLFNVSGGGWGTKIFSGDPAPKEGFSDILLVTTGEFSLEGYTDDDFGWKYTTENAPPILKKAMDKGEAFGFTLTRRYSFDGSKYNEINAELKKEKFDMHAIDSIIGWVR